MVKGLARLINNGRKHKKINSGYTIIEVMTVLAISGVLFVSAVMLFSGQTQRVSFEQSVQDTNSEIGLQVTNVGNSQFLNDRNYGCSSSGAPKRPLLSGSAGSGNQDCVIIGSAIEAIPGSDHLYIYKVLGNRLAYDAGGNVAGPAESVEGSNPTTPSQLVTDYKLGSDLKVVSSKATTDSGSTINTNLIGFYIDFNGESSSTQTSSQSSTVNAYDYGSAAHDVDAVTKCVQKNTCGSPSSASKWSLCVVNQKGDRTAQIDVSSFPNGLTTHLKFMECD